MHIPLKPLILSAALVLATGVVPAPAPAQEPAPEEAHDLPRRLSEEVARFYNAPTTNRLSGPTSIPAGRVEGDVAVLDGPVTVGGTVDGKLLVINGDVELLRGARIRGDLMVIGGDVGGVDVAEIEGEIVLYRERLRYELRDGLIVLEPAPSTGRRDTDRTRRRSAREERGYATLGVSADSYNRVEGLPVYIGPTIQTAGEDPLRLRAQVIVRTESGFRTEEDRLGYILQVEQFLGGRRALRIGGGVHSEIRPIEEWQLSDLENGLSTFLFGRDYRDHYEAEGGRLFARYAPRRGALSWTAEWRTEAHRSQPSGDPWTLFVRDPAWRPQPLVAEGRLTSLAGEALLDTRRGRSGATGWRVEGRLEQALSSDLAVSDAVILAPGGDVFALLPEVAYGTFTHGQLDLRRYERVAPHSRLALRGFVAGALAGELPPQRQHVLGGVGSLPAFPHFSQDCGARRQLVHRPEDLTDSFAPAFFGAYGCQGAALFQVEYRGLLDFEVRPHRRDGDDLYPVGWHRWTGPEWIVFMDAGRAWNDRGEMSTPAIDAGLGFRVGQTGFYLAVPLQGDGGRLSFFVRVGPRF
jgi:hypothetical protein